MSTAGRRPDNVFGQVVYDAMTRAGLNASTLADKLGVSRAAVGKWLHQEPPSFKRLQPLADALDLHPESLYMAAQETRGLPTGVSIPADIMPLVNRLSALPRHRRGKMIDTVVSLIDTFE